MVKDFVRRESKLVTGLIALVIVYSVEVTPFIGPVGHFGILTDGVFAVLLAIIIFAATGVVHHAEALAKIFGEPYGTLLLTMTAVIVEVVMLTHAHAPWARTGPADGAQYHVFDGYDPLDGSYGFGPFFGGAALRSTNVQLQEFQLVYDHADRARDTGLLRSDGTS